jgi:hypothetical protein
MNEPLSRELLISQSLHEIDPPPEPEPEPEITTGEWTCPDCRNMFTYADGTRTCTRSKTCKCAAMPQSIRKKRIAMGRLEQGVLGLQ